MHTPRSTFKLALLPALLLALTLPAAAQTDKSAAPMAAPGAMTTTKPMNADKPVVAGKPVADQKTMPATTAMTKYHAVRASKLMGKNVHSADDKNLGEIEDLIVDMDTGNVRYAVLEFDPGIFKGEKLFAVPLQDLQMVNEKDNLLYKNMSREKLEKVAVEKSDWKKALSNRQFLEGADRTYGMKPPAGNVRTIAASDLIGKNIESREGKGIGEIKELVLDMSAGKVAYAVLAFDPSIFSGEKLFAFSLASFAKGKDKDDLVLNVDKAKIQAMKDFKEDRWAKLNDPDRESYVNSVPK